jgi:EAL domain-containing protein (putative c-di-GMP-specific phosphodiesterase class I)
VRALNSRRGITLAIAIVVLGALAGASNLLGSFLTQIAYDSDRERAVEEAQLLTDLGLAAALADGRLDRRDARAGRAQLAAIQSSLPLLGVAVWGQASRPVFAAGDPIVGRAPPDSVGIARANGAPATSYADHSEGGPQVVVAVPVTNAPGHLVLEYQFARNELASQVSEHKSALYLAAGLAGIVFFLVLLPMLTRLAQRLPTQLSKRERKLLAEFRRGLTRGELQVLYQPKISIETRAIVGVEALVRWDRAGHGLLGPGTFLPTIEKRPSALAAMSGYILDRAVGDCSRWLSEGHRIPVAVNLGASCLLQEHVIEAAHEALRHYGVDSQLLTLEVTESSIIEDEDRAIAILRDLREAGIAVSVDDFGTGYSSLARLRSLPVDELKVDRSFVSSIATDAYAYTITKLIIELGAGLELPVVAEGVESEETLAVLADLGCPVAQGFLFAPAMTRAEIIPWSVYDVPERCG